MRKNKARKTTVGNISRETLEYTAGTDIELDTALVNADCVGSAAHVTMLSRLPVRPRLFTVAERDMVIAELVEIMRLHANGRFKISMEDQDVHLAVERRLTSKIGDLGKKIHTCRSRNDQAALDMRLYAKEQIIACLEEMGDLVEPLLDFACRHVDLPMAGRTHMQPAMPSSVALWASAHAESLLDDMELLVDAYRQNNRCPLGAAAGYGAPLPVDRKLTSDLLGFDRPVHNVIYAVSARGKVESIILCAMAQAMGSLSRLAQDLMLFTMPEFSYFTLPPELCTGSSIMPQKNNPDILELIRARAGTVQSCALTCMDVIKGLPSGYNRDLQETKEPFMKGVSITRSSVRVARSIVTGLKANKKALTAGFTPPIFAADRALELAASGMPFRDAYHHVKKTLASLENMDPLDAIRRKTHEGAPCGLDFKMFDNRLAALRDFTILSKKSYYKAVSRLLKSSYPTG